MDTPNVDNDQLKIIDLSKGRIAVVGLMKDTLNLRFKFKQNNGIWNKKTGLADYPAAWTFKKSDEPIVKALVDVYVEGQKKKSGWTKNRYAKKNYTLQVRLRTEKDDPTVGAPKVPTRGSECAAGWDLYASRAITIPCGMVSGSIAYHVIPKKNLVATDISIKIPKGHYGRIAPRSGLAYKNGIDVFAGVIDCDYRGPIGVVLVNFGPEPFEIKVGDRIAQLIIEQYSDMPIEVMVDFDEDPTDRGEGGFGSTGVSTTTTTTTPITPPTTTPTYISDDIYESGDVTHINMDEVDKALGSVPFDKESETDPTTSDTLSAMKRQIKYD
jgi:dUTP pyrophosphatase